MDYKIETRYMIAKQKRGELPILMKDQRRFSDLERAKEEMFYLEKLGKGVEFFIIVMLRKVPVFDFPELTGELLG